MKIYEYLKKGVKAEINKNIKNKLNAEDVKAWQEAIADEYYSSMYNDCMLNIDKESDKYKIEESTIRELAEEYAKQDIDTFIEYCVEHDYDPYKVWINEWITDRILADDTIEELINGGYIVKK